MSSRAPAGGSATRYSSDLISLATPILISSGATLDERPSRPSRPSRHGLLVGAAESAPSFRTPDTLARQTRAVFTDRLEAVGGLRPAPGRCPERSGGVPPPSRPARAPDRRSRA